MVDLLSLCHGARGEPSNGTGSYLPTHSVLYCAPFELELPEGDFPSSDLLDPIFCICSTVISFLSPLMACSLAEANSGFHSPLPVLALSTLSDLWWSIF